MIELKDLKIGDKFILFDKYYIYGENVLVECILEKKTNKNLFIRTEKIMSPRAQKLDNSEIYKISKSYIEDMFLMDDVKEALKIREEYDYAYNVGISHNAIDLDLEPYEFGKSILEANQRACENFECENCYCYNNDCPIWDTEEHFGMSKSDWDENKEFVNNLDPNDPADAWFFED
jgi:hypothetical protein